MDGFRYDVFKVLEDMPSGPKNLLVKTRSQVVVWAIYQRSIADGRAVSAYAYGFEGTCVWCQGMGDNALEEEAGYGYLSACYACSGTGRIFHALEGALDARVVYPRERYETSYWEEKYGTGSGTTNAEAEGYRTTPDDPQAHWF